MKCSAAARHSGYLCKPESSVSALFQLFDKESQFRSISSIVSGRQGPLNVPVPYPLPNEEGYTRTTSHYHPWSTVRAQITPSGWVIPTLPDCLQVEVGDGEDLSVPTDRS